MAFAWVAQERVKEKLLEDSAGLIDLVSRQGAEWVQPEVRGVKTEVQVQNRRKREPPFLILYSRLNFSSAPFPLLSFIGVNKNENINFLF